MKKKRVYLVSILILTIVTGVFAQGKTETSADSQLTVQSWQHGLGMYKGFTDDDSQTNAIEEDFKKAHPGTDITFNLLRTEHHMQGLRVDFAAGTAPDVIGLASGSVLEEFKDRLEPLRPYAEKEWGANWEDKFTSASFSTIKLSGDEIYAFPSAMSASGLIWYNDSFMAKAGTSIPKTWAELEEATSKLRENDMIPLMFGGKDEWQNADMFIVLLGTINKDLTNKVFAKQADWTHPDVIKAFDYFQKLYTKGIVQDGALATTMYNEGYSLWRDDDGNGSVPMIFNGSWELGTLKPENSYYENFSSKGIELDLFPAIEGNKAVILTCPDVTWAINVDSKNKDAAWKFIKWLADDMQPEVVDSLGFFSVLQNAPVPTVELADDYRACYETISTAIAGTRTLGFRSALYSDINKNLFENLQLLAVKQITPKQAAEAMQKAIM